jgi:hypothetical protein
MLAAPSGLYYITLGAHAKTFVAHRPPRFRWLFETQANSALIRCTVPVPTPSVVAIFRIPIMVRCAG